MKSCVIFAASIFDSSRINVLREFCLSFKQNFSDCDFFTGINPGSVSNLYNIIGEYGLTGCVNYASENLYTNTDASAYQVALLALKNLKWNPKYDLYWFVHTKGGVNNRSSEREMYLNEMLGKRKEIEDMFEKFPQLGSWGIRGNSISAAGVKWNEYNVDSGVPICGNVKLPPFNYTHVNWSYIETLYVLKGEPVENYLTAQSDEFFKTKLSPWYFETVMPWVPSRCGYFPYVKTKRDFWNKCELTDITKQWIDENKLSLESYLNL
jgi:hypothetical protein